MTYRKNCYRISMVTLKFNSYFETIEDACIRTTISRPISHASEASFVLYIRGTNYRLVSYYIYIQIIPRGRTLSSSTHSSLLSIRLQSPRADISRSPSLSRVYLRASLCLCRETWNSSRVDTYTCSSSLSLSLSYSLGAAVRCSLVTLGNEPL